MANDNDDAGKTPEDSGLGNLPPLSDFDSSGSDGGSDTEGLPPLGSFDSDTSDKESIGGLPPISDVSVETPEPTGGNVKPPPAGFDSAELESPAFGTPPPAAGDPGTGFADLAADSDFSPETPEIGPGPDSDVDTPMFDSAFGGDTGAGDSPAFETPAPTQAMETPMFGDSGAVPAAGDAGAFDPGAFDVGAFDAGALPDAGTPAPDFTPDTGMTGQEPLIPAGPPPGAAAPKGGKSTLMMVAMVIVGVVVGIHAGQFLSKTLSYMPNPYKQDVAQKDDEIGRLKKIIDTRPAAGPGQPVVSVEQIEELAAQQKQLQDTIDQLTQHGEAAQGTLNETTTALEAARGDLDALNEEFVQAQDAFDDLQNSTAIVKARQVGLLSEVDRLTGLTGQLDESNTRRRATKEGLEYSVDRLTIQVKEGIPLTPEKYSRAGRLAAVEDLKAQVSSAKWVTPALLDAYTNIYQKELEIAEASTYFFAKIPAKDRYGAQSMKWAECVMRGNWAVVFRTLDGKNSGVYENIAASGDARVYGFREMLSKEAKETIELEIFASRTPGFEDKLRVLVEKQAIADGDSTDFQQVFNSL